MATSFSPVFLYNLKFVTSYFPKGYNPFASGNSIGCWVTVPASCTTASAVPSKKFLMFFKSVDSATKEPVAVAFVNKVASTVLIFVSKDSCSSWSVDTFVLNYFVAPTYLKAVSLFFLKYNLPRPRV